MRLLKLALGLSALALFCAPSARAESGPTRKNVVRVDADPKIDWLKLVTPERVTDVRLPNTGKLFHFSRDPIAAQALSNTAAAAELPWWVKRLNVPAAWAVTKGAGVKVCVIDTGIDRTHPDLKDRIAGG